MAVFKLPGYFASAENAVDPSIGDCAQAFYAIISVSDRLPDIEEGDDVQGCISTRLMLPPSLSRSSSQSPVMVRNVYY